MQPNRNGINQNGTSGKSILMLIIKKENLWSVIDTLQDNNVSNRFLVLKTINEKYQDYFFVIYDSDPNIRLQSVHPVIVHRKGKCFYTINALNKMVQQENGVVDKQYLIDWDSYQNQILIVTKEKELQKIPTKLYKIIK